MPSSGEVIPSPYKTLILEDGVKISVENGGNIEVAAMHYASHGGKDYGGRPVNGYGHIIMNGSSSIVLNSGANLYAWGYITGSDDAQVIAEKGSTIHEKMQVSDYRGGNLTTDCTKDGHFPFSQYYIQNIEIKEVIKSGANLKCYATIYASAVLEEESVSFMGDGAMFTLGEGAQATKYYDAATDRLIVDVKGSFSFNSISLMGEDTSEFVLPLQQNLTINLESGAIATVDQDIMLQPGCEINIGEGAKLTIASGKSVYLMDKDQWGNFCSAAPRPIVQVTYVASRNGAPVLRTVSADAYLNINGTLIVEGQLYASASHASIVSTGKTGVIQFVSATNASSSINLCSTVSDQDPAWSVIAMTPVFLTNTDGSTVDTAGTAAGTTYSFHCDIWQTITVDAAVDPTCTATGLTEGSHYTTCGCVIEEQEEVPALGHKPVTDAAVAPGCTSTGLAEGSHCSRCGEVLVAQEIVDALGHNYAAEVTDPTCTDKGYTTHTCSGCGDSYIDSETEAHGHTFENGICTACGVAGDIDNNGELSIADCVALRKYLLDGTELTEEEFEVADFNGDGEISIADCVAMRAYLLAHAL